MNESQIKLAAEVVTVLLLGVLLAIDLTETGRRSRVRLAALGGLLLCAFGTLVVVRFVMGAR